MKKIFSILFALVLVLSFSLVVTTPVAAATLEVGSGKPYSTIQSAVDAASDWDTIMVYAGTYQEQVVINKSLTLVGTGVPVIQAPASLTKFKVSESGAWWDPVVFAFGGTNTGGTVSGTGTVTVSISGFTIDGNDRLPYDRAAGIFLRNAGGTISDNTVQNMRIDGKQTFGIMVYGDSDVEITGNDVSGYSRGGIGANGDSVTSSPSYPTPHVVVDGNTVTGPGMGTPVTNAPNGIQIGWGATGRITGNTVTGNGWPGPAWAGSGIIVAGADNVEVDDNTVEDNEIGIAVCGWMWDPAGVTADGTWIHGNTVDGNTYGISVQDKSPDTTIEGNTVKNSSYDGIDICNFYGYAPTGTVIECNTITDNNALDDSTSGGIWVDDGVDGDEVTVNLNNIVGNKQYGILNTSTTNDVDAEDNWWGDVSGPYHSSNPSGTGDTVSDYVDFTPWLTTTYPPGTSVATGTGTGTAYLSAGHGAIENLTGIVPPSLPSVSFPHGMFSFQITGLTPGQTVTVTITLPGPVPVGTLWWKYDSGSWYSLPNLSDNGDNIMVIQLTDGGSGDLDGIADGTITDPGGPGNPMTVGWDGSPVSKATVLAPWLALLAAIIAGASLLVLRRRRAQI